MKLKEYLSRLVNCISTCDSKDLKSIVSNINNIIFS